MKTNENDLWEYELRDDALILKRYAYYNHDKGKLIEEDIMVFNSIDDLVKKLRTYPHNES